VCGASTWSHTMLETSGTGPSDQGSLETTIPVTGPFTPGSGFRGRHGTRTCLAQQRSPLNATDKNGPLTEPRSLSPSYGGLSPGHGPIHLLLASRLCKMHASPLGVVATTVPKGTAVMLTTTPSSAASQHLQRLRRQRPIPYRRKLIGQKLE
jgi:hypothetical protein